MRTIRGILAEPFGQTAMIAAIASLAYFVVFGARFLFFNVGPGGDTQNVWSDYWIAVYSLRHFHEFLWWDPTALNGWPAYYLNNHGWATMLSPFQLAQQFLGAVVNGFSHLETTQYLVLQKTLFAVLINIVAITLIARELVTSTVARVFPPLVYAVCQIQFLGYLAAATVDALPAVLFLFYGLVRYNNRRTPGSLLLLLLFAGIYAGSMNYMTLQSHFYPMAFFVILMLALFPRFLSSLWINARLLAKTRLGAATLAAGLLLVLAGAIVFIVGISGNLPNFARVTSGSIPYDINRANAWDGPGYGIVSTEIWTNLFYWIPYSDLHAFTMKFDPYASGNEYRYIGLVTLPLIVIALATRLKNGYTACFALAFFLCISFVTLTYQSLPFSLLIEASDIFKNIRTMALVMPRDLASLFPIFLAAIGLDFVMSRAPDRTDEQSRRLVDIALFALILLAGWCLFQLATSPQYSAIRKSLGHIGVYLLLYSGILLIALRAREEQIAKKLGWALLLVSFVDLSTSASDQWLHNNGAGRYYHGKGASAMKAEQNGIGPLASEADSWPGTYYAGMVHNVHQGGPHFGLKPWLALVTRPAWQPVVDNWNPATRMVTQYPYFKFFTNGTYVPETAIRTIDSVTPPATELPTRIVERNGGPQIRMDGHYYPIVTADLGVVEHAAKSRVWPDRQSMTGWALEKPNKPVRLVLIFVGDELWYRGSPNQNRPDIAKEDRALLKSGFHFEYPELPEEAVRGSASVRVFAVTQDNRATELQYVNGYPFTRSVRKAVSNKPADPDSAQAGRPAFYVHDSSLVLPGAPGRRLYDVKWEVLKFTFNRVTVKVDLPESAYMLFLDNYAPNWRAYVNGERRPVKRANFAFKTIYLPAGSSVVEWVYNPMGSKIAWGVYYFLLVLAVGLLVWWGRRVRPVSGS